MKWRRSFTAPPLRMAAVSNLQIVEELCRICEAQSFIIKAQAEALAQVGAVVMEEERADVGRSLSAFIGRDEVPDEAEALAEAAEY